MLTQARNAKLPKSLLKRKYLSVVVVEASAPKVYPRVTLASSSTFSGSVVRTLRGGEGLPNMFCLVASSLGHLRNQCSIVCGSFFAKRTQGVCGGSGAIPRNCSRSLWGHLCNPQACSVVNMECFSLKEN